MSIIFFVLERLIETVIKRSADDISSESVWGFYLSRICLRIVWKMGKIVPASFVTADRIAIRRVENEIAGKALDSVVPDF